MACAAPALAHEPRTHGLIVAVSQFSDPELAPFALQGAELDAQRMAAAFADFAGPGAEATVLTGGAATLAETMAQLGRLRTSVAPGDRVMLYFSAHGSRIPDIGEIDESDGQDEVLLLADAGEWDGAKVPGALVDDDLAAAVRGLRALGADVFLVIDSCASGGAMRSGSARQVRNLPPALLHIPVRTMRSAQRRDSVWVEDDMPAGSGRLVTFAASPTYAAAWDSPEGGLFTQSLAKALAQEPIDFVSLAQDQQRENARSALPGPRSEIGGAVESAFFFNGAVPDVSAAATALPNPGWTLDLYAAPQARCDSNNVGIPRELDPAVRQTLAHCDAVMLSVMAQEPGYFDTWYVDSAGQRTLLSPVAGYYLDGRYPTDLSFTFVAEDPSTGEPYPAGTDRLLLMRRNAAGDHDAAVTIEFAVAEPS